MENLDLQRLSEMANSLTPAQIVETERLIQNYSRVTSYEQKVALGTLFAVAILACFGRIFIRLYSQRRLSLDDGFLIFSALCLTGATTIEFKSIRLQYLQYALLRNDPNALIIGLDKLDALFQHNTHTFIYVILMWNTVFGVKGCYLAFFHHLLRAMNRKIIYYYRFAIGLSIVSWLYLITGNQLIACPHLGKSAVKCFPKLPASKSALLFLFWSCPVLDGLTDLIIVSIPILILRQSQLRMLTKIGLGLFLCLSLFMVIFSILRASLVYYGGALDFPWQTFCLHAESCIAVTMASLTVYRSTLVGSNEVSDKIQVYFARVFGRTAPGSGKTEKSFFGLGWVKIPGAKLSGLRTRFLGTNRTEDQSNLTGATLGSDIDSIETDYHAHIKKSTMANQPYVSSPSVEKKPMHIRREEQTNMYPSEEPQRIGRVFGFFVRFLLPSSYGVMLQHRTIGTGQV